MRARTRLLVAGGLAVATVAQVQGIRPHFDAVREAYSGERAREIVAFVEQFWRLPGNSGFDASIDRVAEVLEDAGYVLQSEAMARPGGPRPETNGTDEGGGNRRQDRPEPPRLVYRIERRPMAEPTWEPVDAVLRIVGDDEPLLEFSSNRNMIAAYSHSTPPAGIEAEVVRVDNLSAEGFGSLDARGKVVLADQNVGRLFREAVQQRGAIGVLSYSMPAYTRPEVNRDSIQFSSIPYDPEAGAWGLRLSFAARERLLEALSAGPTRVRVQIEARIFPSEELTLVADVRGATRPDERLVFSAHVQEPGANDNASGVGALAEGARVLGELVGASRFDPARTITMLWGDEISSTRRYLEEDPQRSGGVLWGISLDMVGEDTALTGGTFLIEKMPDPSAIWTRGQDQHSEWGGRPLGLDDMTPHYLNDFVLNRCREQAADTGWVVKTNPFEGGSDHVPFLRAGKPGLLLWHFTDQYYHTDSDRLDKVSAETLRNVGVCALVAAMTLTTADGPTARTIIAELESAALARIEAELALSLAALAGGADRDEQALILRTWTDWYTGALRATGDIEIGGSSEETLQAIEASVDRVVRAGQDAAARLR